MKKSTKKIMGVLLVAVGLIFIGIMSYILFFQDEPTNILLEGEEKNAALATIRTVIYEKKDSLEISSQSSSCLDYGNGCTITTPIIIVDEKHEALGWGELEEVNYNIGEEIVITKDMTLYPIIKEKTIKEIDIDVNNVCSKDLKCNIGNKVVDTACSQVGYVEKNSDLSLEECSTNAGENNYQKFGNNGNVWDASFIDWVFKSVKISLFDKGIEDISDVTSYVKWAKNNNKWYTSKSILHNGDLVLTNNNQHIGIAVNIDGEWYEIIGNYNNKVELVIIENISGFINMKGLSY